MADKGKPKNSKKIGRPKGSGLIHKPEDHIDKICDWISEGKTLRDYCRQPGCPSYCRVYHWLENDEIFSKRFARAREIGEEVIALECLAIADNPIYFEKVKQSEDGIEITKEDALGHRKLQIDTRLKLLAKWNPKKYGDKTIHSGDENSPIAITEVVRKIIKANE